MNANAFPGSAGVSPASSFLHTSSTRRRDVTAPRGAFRFHVLTLLTFLTFLTFSTHAAAPSPFVINATFASSNAAAWVTFDFLVPPDHVLYAERLAFFDSNSNPIKPATLPDPVMHLDAVSRQQKLVYDHPFSATLKLDPVFPTEVLVKLQGCSNSACYFPEKHFYTVTSSGIAPKTEPLSEDTSQPANITAASNQVDTNGFLIAARETGYIPKKAFLEFLEQSKTGRVGKNDALEKFDQLGPLVSLLFIVLGGIGLNLTPCVLPLIPINLAIIGAGARASSRRRGFVLGGTYGLGMALVYGVLGLVVVLGGAKFGTLNSSAWFNLVIAVIFLLMSLAMFDRVNIDFSRFQGRGGSSATSHGPFLLALSTGAVAALLAGACVAPVVISVLLLAAHLYAKGAVAGLLLPFLLGLGMALPWPFAGAGLSFLLLPKPGQWMKWVKYSFGVLILLFAGYYGHLAYNIFRSDSMLVASARSVSEKPQTLGSNAVLAAGLQEARAQSKPLLIDFAASWCKNCLAMDSTVFSASEVKQRLNDFVVVRYDAEKPNEPPAKEVLDQFGVLGLPTYVVLVPER